jgi:hypothetical protein
VACASTYESVARALIAAPDASEAVRGRLGAALAQAAQRGAPTAAAWDLRHAFDDLLRAARVAPRAAAKLTLAAAPREVLVKAIRVGAPAYNEGRADVCARVYRDAARECLLHLAGASEATQVLERALRDASGRAHSEAAWVLRHAFDQLLAAPPV